MTARDTRDSDTPRVASPQAVRAAIAGAVLDTQPPAVAADDNTMGSIVLLPHQRDAVNRLRPILSELHTALLADDVGLGKTYVALALAREYPQVLIIAPAALLAMWRAAVIRAACRNARVESLHGYSRTGVPHVRAEPRTLVIVDEAHHLRTPSTKRYRAVSDAVSGCDLLLISATPVHNRPKDLRALLALALGTQAGRVSDDLLARLVVRRTTLTGLPRVRTHQPIAVPHDPAILDAVLALPAPLPAHDGAVAGALIRLGLLRAWCSSDAALTHALRQRLLRGEALKHALESGRHPTSAELRSWLVGDHEVQLAFPELLAGHAPATGPLLDVLATHLHAVRNLLSDHQRTARGDVVRANALRGILSEHPHVPVVAFSQYATTVRAIGRALADIAGVGILYGRRASIASGAISRNDALAHFAPVAQGRPPPPAHQRIKLLLTTDLLAEGVNLQDAGVVVHLDLPWTDAARLQRVGRVVRLGSLHNEIVVYRFEPPNGAEAALRLYARLDRKARLSARLVGAQSSARSAVSRSAADSATELRALLTSWLPDADMARGSPRVKRPMVCTVHGRRAGFVAVVTTSDGTRALVGGRRSHDALGKSVLHVSTSPRRVLRLIRGAASRTTVAARASTAWPSTRRALFRWLRRRELTIDVGDAECCASTSHRRAHGALTRAVARLSPLERVGLRSALQQAFAMLAAARGVAAERSLDAWTATGAEMTCAQWLTHWRAWPPLAQVSATPSPPSSRSPNQRPCRPRIVAALMIETVDESARR